MPSPFPGMDPYLESPTLWPGLHVALIVRMQAALNPRLLPNYIAQIETRVYVLHDEDPTRREFVADVSVERQRKSRRRDRDSNIQVVEPVVFPFPVGVEVEEPRIEIKDRRGNRLVAVIELLSPTNKIRGSEGRDFFLDKRREIISAPVHWVEIDLLRGGDPTVPALTPRTDYRIVLSRAGDRGRTRGWLFSVRQALPAIGIPLAAKDKDVPLALGAVFNAVYDDSGYEFLIDYTRPPERPLSPADAKWANQLLRAKGLR
ncbi:MAG TPA: DUF4058 family protein [Gemmataceae bacterium]|nr:DUF4058 family protein [Gemmataceae bacterium]